MRLIDADEIPYGPNFPVVSKPEIDKMPTIDAVRVVRCKTCAYWDSVSWYCPDVARRTCPDGYCHWGERSDDDS